MSGAMPRRIVIRRRCRAPGTSWVIDRPFSFVCRTSLEASRNCALVRRLPVSRVGRTGDALPDFMERAQMQSSRSGLRSSSLPASNRNRDFGMNFPRRTFLRLTAGTAALPAAARLARAETYPSRPVRLIVGAVPGSAPDVIARLIAQSLAERLGQSFVIENRSGASGNTEAVERVAAHHLSQQAPWPRPLIGFERYWANKQRARARRRF
jgi:hypothetical protein